ncbi:MAG: type II toxin-antitoxin system VapB family antitoxin [SAR202 cluster bacterium]|jgi:Arc/MetJ family transcription regulator|nr:type II toxin-antitoxin system VapB family antitoxin [SAR202 cluster bacterium]MDP6513644.1 type II toxin-antitoxin system VapB family antitoxin [SAR202 cluster bacterium]MDP6713323.1 type II toxin-antitoxin system VapB family antitoxin [SAR202 cluster bacterium]
MIRTTLDLDEKLLEQVIEATGEKSKTKAVNKAMEEYVRQLRINHLLSREGNYDLNLDDWYEFRHMEHDDWPK